MTSTKTLARRIADYLDREGPKWAPQIASHIEGGPLPVATIEAALRSITAKGTFPLGITPKRGYFLLHTTREISIAQTALDTRIEELRRWHGGLTRARARMEADAARTRTQKEPVAHSRASRPAPR